MPTVDDIKNVLPSFVGTIKQTPPVYSAIKVEGKRACDLVRDGKKVELEARDIVINDLQFNGFVEDKTAEFVVDCGRGCYVRSLGVDIAKSLGAVAYVSKIIRSRVGNFRIENAINIEDLNNDAYEVLLNNLITV